MRRAALVSLGSLRDPRALGPLRKALTDEDVTIRQDAALAIAPSGDKRLVDALIAALDDCEKWVRIEVAAALSRLGDNRALSALETLRQQLERDSDPSTREAVARAIERLRSR